VTDHLDIVNGKRRPLTAEEAKLSNFKEAKMKRRGSHEQPTHSWAGKDVSISLFTAYEVSPKPLQTQFFINDGRDQASCRAEYQPAQTRL
jgi:hypothetical protein